MTCARGGARAAAGLSPPIFCEGSGVTEEGVCQERKSARCCHLPRHRSTQFESSTDSCSSMGKQTRRNRMKDRVKHECPVCMEPFANELGGGFDNALACKNAHHLCVECVGRVAEPTDKCSPSCSGLAFTCPLCRVSACLSNFHLLVVTKKSWQKAYECFPCSQAVNAWNERS